jgi:hypothetical protein
MRRILLCSLVLLAGGALAQPMTPSLGPSLSPTPSPSSPTFDLPDAEPSPSGLSEVNTLDLAADLDPVPNAPDLDPMGDDRYQTGPQTTAEPPTPQPYVYGVPGVYVYGLPGVTEPYVAGEAPSASLPLGPIDYSRGAIDYSRGAIDYRQGAIDYRQGTIDYGGRQQQQPVNE